METVTNKSHDTAETWFACLLETPNTLSLKMETAQILLRLHVMLAENKSAVCGLPQQFPLAAVHGCGIGIPEVKQSAFTGSSTPVEDSCSLQALSRC